MSLPARVRIPAGAAEAELGERGSRFLARAERALTVEEGDALRERERRRFHGATHHVLACRPLQGDPRSDDDGEPAGTGGRPVLDAIEALDLRAVAVVVTRWYGGTKLGTGGLARAYGGIARAALDRMAVVEAVPAVPCEVAFEHADTGAVMRLLDEAGARRGELRYGRAALVEALVPRDAVEPLARRLADATAGRARVAPGEGTRLLPLDGRDRRTT
ncbi:MAG TPA: YigZ family protein [Gemmatimonadota bacterium]|nr:YigZ family protein [Gemmatimonadota bacterium]